MGAAQVAPVFFDRAGTLKRTCEWIAKAGEARLDLVVFPETYFAAYPYWRGAVSVRRSTELIVRMQDCAIRIPGEETEALCQETRRADVRRRPGRRPGLAPPHRPAASSPRPTPCSRSWPTATGSTPRASGPS